MESSAARPQRRAPSLLAAALRDGTGLTTPEGATRPPRPFCGIGVCLECETEVDGRVVRACLVGAPA